MHGDYLRRPGLWPAGTVPEQSDFQKLDLVQSRVINGDDGGTWTPSSAIVLGGAGGSLSGISNTLTGGATTKRGGRLVLGANDFVFLDPPRLHTLKLSGLRQQMTASRPYRGRSFDFKISAPPNPAGFQILQSPLQISVPGRYIHKGANFVGASMRFRMPSIPAATSGPFLVFGGVVPDVSSGQTFSPGNYLFGTVLTNAWAPATSFALGSYVKPTTTNATGFYYKATAVSGTHTTGGVEPTWPTVIGGTVVDNAGANQITWTCTGYLGQLPWATWNTPSLYLNNSNPQTLQYTTDPALTTNVMDPTTYKYLLIIGADLGTIVHSVTLFFSNITSTAFE